MALAATAGLVLDPWQAWVLCLSLSENDDLRWVATQVLLVVSRQNGKGGILEARELAGLFLLDEQKLIHTAHQVKTASRHRQRLEKLIKQTPELNAMVKRYNHSHGQESIELHAVDCSTVGPQICDCIGGKTIEFLARSKASGRGFDGDLVMLDECMFLSEDVMEALVPVMSSKDNPQIWFTGSAADDDEAAKVMRRLRALALVEQQRLTEQLRRSGPGFTGEWQGAGLLMLEWSVPRSADKDDRANWAAANPALGIRMRIETIADERETLLSDESFGKERLGMWGETSGEAVVGVDVWAARTDRASMAEEPLVFAVEVDSAGQHGAIGVASRRPDGLWHVELVEAAPRTDWIVDACLVLRRRHRHAPILTRTASGAAPTIKLLEAAGITPVKATARDYQQACSRFEAAVFDDQVRHLDDQVLATAVEAGRKLQRDDAWVWDRDDAQADITPLVAVTMALHGIQQLLAAGVTSRAHVPTDPDAFVDQSAPTLRW